MPEPVLYAEPAVGYRAWVLRIDRGEARIYSMRPKIKPVVWHPGEDLVAECRNHPDAPADQPTDKADCGIYAWDSRRKLEWNTRWGRYRRLITGEVELWGRTFKHEFGYRGQFARPRAFYLPPFEPDSIPQIPLIRGEDLHRHYKTLREHLARAAETYDVPLVSFRPDAS